MYEKNREANALGAISRKLAAERSPKPRSVTVENPPASVSLSSSSSSSKDEDRGMSSSGTPSTDENERRKKFQQDEAQCSREENQSAGSKDEFETVYLSKMVETFDESLEAMQLHDTQKGKMVPTRVLLQALESISPSLFSELERSEFMKSFNSRCTNCLGSCVVL